MQIVNSGRIDCHAHTSNFSDGMSTVEEIVRAAVDFGIKELWLTDHSDACYPDCSGAFRRPRSVTSGRWKPIQEGIIVRFGIECDLLNENGDICDQIQGETSEYLILSAHPETYVGKPEMITAAYINAIKRHGDRLKFIGHPCAKYYAEHLRIDELVSAALEHDLPLEVNCGYLIRGCTDLEKLKYLLNWADKIYLNSDAHTLQELRDLRQQGLQFLEEGGWLKWEKTL
jgi:histidinol phosphatase-like PHP family hydrolase